MKQQLYCLMITEDECSPEPYHAYFDHEPTMENCIELVKRKRFRDDYEPTQEELDEEPVEIYDFYSFIVKAYKKRK